MQEEALKAVLLFTHHVTAQRPTHSN